MIDLKDTTHQIRDAQRSFALLYEDPDYILPEKYAAFRDALVELTELLEAGQELRLYLANRVGSMSENLREIAKERQSDD